MLGARLARLAVGRLTLNWFKRWNSLQLNWSFILVPTMRIGLTHCTRQLSGSRGNQDKWLRFEEHVHLTHNFGKKNIFELIYGVPLNGWPDITVDIWELSNCLQQQQNTSFQNDCCTKCLAVRTNEQTQGDGATSPRSCIRALFVVYLIWINV